MVLPGRARILAENNLFRHLSFTISLNDVVKNISKDCYIYIISPKNAG